LDGGADIRRGKDIVHLLLSLSSSSKDVNDNSPEIVGPRPIRLKLDIDEVEELVDNMAIGRITVEDQDTGENGLYRLHFKEAEANR
jgi:hypothetical protein